MQLAFLKLDLRNSFIGKSNMFAFIVIDDVFTLISAVLFCFLLPGRFYLFVCFYILLSQFSIGLAKFFVVIADISPLLDQRLYILFLASIALDY